MEVMWSSIVKRRYRRVFSSGQVAAHGVAGAPGEEWFAVKEFNVSDAGEMARSLREAALLWRLKHPAIAPAELKAVFFEAEDAGVTVSRICLQMPLYAQGQLDEWILSRAPEWWMVRHALVDVLGGLEHLHHLQVVHGDVKPANILIDARDRARLADFDVSVDAATCPSAAHAMRAFSMGFTAPEVLQEGSSAASDVFSVGRTAAAEPVRSVCQQPGSEPEDESVDAFVGQLARADKAAMPSSAQARTHPFCTAVARRLEPRSQARECCVKASDRCAELPVQVSAGVECEEGHFTCQACLEGVTVAAMGAELAVRRRREGRVACPKHPRECRESALDDAALVRVLPGEVVRAYLGSRVKLVEAAKAEELEQEYRSRAEAELERLLAMDAAQREAEAARKHIEDKVLQLACPRCVQAFVDFEGCCALSCSRCGCAFCAWCLQDCGSDAHQHVGRCDAKPPAARADPFFAPKEVVDAAQRTRRTALLREYLATLSTATRDGVVRSIRAVLDERLPGWREG